MVTLAVIGLWLDLMILQVFSNLNDSVILCVPVVWGTNWDLNVQSMQASDQEKYFGLRIGISKLVSLHKK